MWVPRRKVNWRISSDICYRVYEMPRKSVCICKISVKVWSTAGIYVVYWRLSAYWAAQIEREPQCPTRIHAMASSKEDHSIAHHRSYRIVRLQIITTNCRAIHCTTSKM